MQPACTPWQGRGPRPSRTHTVVLSTGSPNSSLHRSRDTDSWVPNRPPESGSDSPHPPPPPGPQRVICWTRTLCKAQAGRAHHHLARAGGFCASVSLTCGPRPGPEVSRGVSCASRRSSRARAGGRPHPLPSSGTFCSVGVAVAMSPPCCRVTCWRKEHSLYLCKVSAQVWGAVPVPEDRLLAPPAAGVAWGGGAGLSHVSPVTAAASSPRGRSWSVPCSRLLAGWGVVGPTLELLQPLALGEGRVHCGKHTAFPDPLFPCLCSRSPQTRPAPHVPQP